MVAQKRDRNTNNNVNNRVVKKVKISDEMKRAKVYNILNQINPKNHVYNTLYSLYKDADKTLYSRADIFSLKNGDLKTVIDEQIKVINKNVRGGGKNTIKIAFKNNIDKIDFCLLMWLDISHDQKETQQEKKVKNDKAKKATLPTEKHPYMSFENFLKSDLLKKFLNGNPSFTITKLIEKMINLNIIEYIPKDHIRERKGKNGRTRRTLFKKGYWPKQNFETLIKSNLSELFSIQKPLEINPVSVKLSDKAINKVRKPIYIVIDSESEFKIISKLIENSKYQFNSANGTIDRYFVKPLITLSNRLDPGRLMPGKSSIEEFSKLFDKRPRSTQLYNITECDFTFGSTNISIKHKNMGEFEQKLNNKILEYGTTAKTAKKTISTNTTNSTNTADNNKLSKFLGDFMQILTVLSNPVEQRTVLATLDGVMCGIHCFISKRLMNQEPKLFIDMSFKQQPKVLMYGVSDLLKKNSNIKQTKSNIGSNIKPGRNVNRLNTIPEVSSGSNRSKSKSISNSNSNSNSISKRRVIPMNVNTKLREGTGNTKNINAKSGTLGKLARFLTVKQKANTNIAPSKRKMAQAVIKSNNNTTYRLPLSPKEQQILKNKMNINNRRIVVNKSNNSTNGAMATNNNNNNVTQRIKK